MSIPIGSSVQQFGRLLVGDTLYHSKQHSRTKCRNNTICCYYSEGSTGYGTIRAFYLSKHAPPFCLIEAFNISNDTSPLTNLRPSRNREISALNVRSIIPHQIIHVTNHSKKLVAVPIEQIVRKCIHISVSLGRPQTYVIRLPNPYELH